MMTQPRTSARALAEEIVALEASSQGSVVEQDVMVKLYGTLGKLIGAHGFDVVLARALNLAQRDEASLASVTCAPGGQLTGFDPKDREAALVALLAHLMELLMRFIGEDLAVRIVRDAWPNVTFAAGAIDSKEKSK